MSKLLQATKIAVDLGYDAANIDVPDCVWLPKSFWIVHFGDATAKTTSVYLVENKLYALIGHHSYVVRNVPKKADVFERLLPLLDDLAECLNNADENTQAKFCLGETIVSVCHTRETYSAETPFANLKKTIWALEQKAKDVLLTVGERELICNLLREYETKLKSMGWDETPRIDDMILRLEE